MDIHQLFLRPIAPGVPPQRRWQEIPIRESGEGFVCLNDLSAEEYQIIVDPQFYRQGVQGAISDAMLRESAAKRLVKAASLLPADMRLVVWDAWRPEAVQKGLFERKLKEIKRQQPNWKDKEAIAAAVKFETPINVSTAPDPHLTGGAVDVTLVTAEGNFFNFGCTYRNEVQIRRTRFFEDKIEKQALSEVEQNYLQNRRLLYWLMTTNGFVNNPERWWEYSFGTQPWAVEKGYEYAFYGKTV